MPHYTEKTVSKINENTILFMIISQKNGPEDDDFDPVVKVLHFQRNLVDGKIVSLTLKGNNFNFQEFRRTKLLTDDVNVTINDTKNEATIPIEKLPADLREWHGDIAFLIIYILHIENLEKYIEKVDKEIKKNDVRKKDHVSKRAYERYESIIKE